MDEKKVESNKAKLIPAAKEIMMLAEQRGYARSDILNAGLLALGRMLQREQDSLIAKVRDQVVPPPVTPPQP